MTDQRCPDSKRNNFRPQTFSIIFILIALFALNLVSAQTGADANDLYTTLFTNSSYNYKIRPAINQSLATTASVSLFLLAFNELNEVAETLKTTCYLQITWNDEFLTWNSSDFGGIQYAYYPQNDVWKPDVALQNSNNDYKQIGDSTMNVVLQSTGDITWQPHQVFVSTCSVNIKYFPFDTQTCSMVFAAWSYTSQEVFLQVGNASVDISEMEGNTIWEILSTSALTSPEADDSYVMFTIKMQRKPAFYIFSFILPVVMLSMLNIATFALPCDSGERAGYAVTVFLSLAVFFTIITSVLPASSDVTSVFSIYILIMTLLSTFITLLCLIFIRINLFDDATPVPVWLRKLTIFILRMRTNTTSAEEMSKKQPIHVREASDMDSKSENSEGPNIQWKQVVNALDLVCFFSILIISFLVTVVCLGICAAHAESER